MGADGMLGHQLVRSLHAAGHSPVATTRRPPEGSVAEALADIPVLTQIDARQRDSVVAALAETAPDAVINCVGIVKQRPEAKDAVQSIRVNGLFPHELAALCRLVDARLIHVSTDCVFSGQRGGYTEVDIPDPVDLYGRTKLLGEVEAPRAITLRTSIIGLELGRSDSLVEWFLAQRGSAKGWTRALYSGLTTFELARVMILLLEDAQDLHGLWHVSSRPIDKYALLCGLRDALGRDLAVEPDARITIDRTLDSERFWRATGWRAPEWTTMLAELATAIREREVSRGV